MKQFKTSIESTVGVTDSQQRLIYCGKVLVDDKLLSEYDLNGKTVHLVVRAPPSHAGPSTSTASSADASGNFSSARPSSLHGRTETNQHVVGAWYLPSAFDHAGIQSMVQGVISNLGELGRGASVVSSDDGSAVDVRINLSHLPNAPAAIAANIGHAAAAAAAVWPPAMATDATPSIIQHSHFTPLTSTVPVRVYNNSSFPLALSDPNLQQLQVNLRVNLIRNRLTIIQSEFQEIQRFAQQNAAAAAAAAASSSETASASAPSQPAESTSTSNVRSDEAPMETSTSSTSESTTTNIPNTSEGTSSPAGLDVAARAASAAASAAETAAIFARQAAATLEAAIYSHRTQRQQGSSTVRQSTTTNMTIPPITLPPLTLGVVPVSIDIETVHVPSTSTAAATATAPTSARASSSFPSQGASNGTASHGQDASATEAQRRMTAVQFADLLRSVRQAESNYHQQLITFEESLRSPYNSSCSNRNAQIQSLLHRVRHQLVLINNTLSEISVDFTNPQLPVVVQAIPVDTLSPPSNTRSPRSSSTSRSPNGEVRPASANDSRTSTGDSSGAPSSQQQQQQAQQRVVHTARVAVPHPNPLGLATSTPLTLYGGYRFTDFLPATNPSLNHRLVFSQNRGHERSDASNRNASTTTSTPHSSSQQGQQQQNISNNSNSQPATNASVGVSSNASSSITSTLSSAAQAALDSSLNSASISTSNWQSSVAPAWVPVIANDLTRQQTQSNSSGITFSDAYLNGLPKKKRRTDEDGGGN